jgi:signal transduction histidine kinase
MGLRTMAYRASVIGATFNVERLSSRGTRVICKLSEVGIPSETHDTKS